jgi:hypothetical protein
VRGNHAHATPATASRCRASRRASPTTRRTAMATSASTRSRV